MRLIIKFFLLFSFLCSSLLANIDEYKSDLYYANGINMTLTPDEAEIEWRKKVKLLLSDRKDIANIEVSYNQSQNAVYDLFESLGQVLNNELNWEIFSELYIAHLEKNFPYYNDTYHEINLDTQVENYKQSIKNGHGVVIIAHSQGNYFTNEAYEKLDNWMKDYFHMFGVATPANHVAGYEPDDMTAPYVTFHNDIINIVVTGLPSNRHDSHHNGFPSYVAHDFYNSYLINEETKNDITNFIKKKLDDHVKAPTQWKTKEEIKYGTKEYRIKVEHMFDSNVIVDTEVYPFDPAKKLYQAKDNQDNLQYVKGGYGGIQIQDENNPEWADRKEEQFYRLKGTDPVEYIEFTCKDHSTFEILSHQNIGTKEWRVTVKNKDTNETQEGVYPFNLKGSLYQLDNGEWVLASCGGESIEEMWDGQGADECHRLQGTGEIIKIECSDGHYWNGIACAPYENQATYILDEINGEISNISFYTNNSRTIPLVDDYILFLEAGKTYHAIDYSNTRNCAGTLLSHDIFVNNYFTQATFDDMAVRLEYGVVAYQDSWTPVKKTITEQFGLSPVNTPIISNTLEDLIATIPHDDYEVTEDIIVANSYHEKNIYAHFSSYIGISGGYNCGSIIPNEPFPKYINPSVIITKIKYYFRNNTKREVTFYWKD